MGRVRPTLVGFPATLVTLDEGEGHSRGSRYLERQKYLFDINKQY